MAAPDTFDPKRYEPFRSKASGDFSKAYWRPVWGDDMDLFEQMRDSLANEQIAFERLDAVQLVKHAFGLRSEAQRRTRKSFDKLRTGLRNPRNLRIKMT